MKKLRCYLGFCKNLHCEIHVTRKLPEKGKEFESAIMYRCDDCGKVKRMTASFTSFFIVPEKYKQTELVKNGLRIELEKEYGMCSGDGRMVVKLFDGDSLLSEDSVSIED